MTVDGWYEYELLVLIGAWTSRGFLIGMTLLMSTSAPIRRVRRAPRRRGPRTGRRRRAAALALARAALEVDALAHEPRRLVHIGARIDHLDHVGLGDRLRVEQHGVRLVPERPLLERCVAGEPRPHLGGLDLEPIAQKLESVTDERTRDLKDAIAVRAADGAVDVARTATVTTA